MLNFLKTLLFIALVVIACLWAKDKFFDEDFNLKTKNEIETVNIKEPEPETIVEPEKQNSKDKKQNEVQYATIYLLGVGSEGDAVFKKVKREVPQNSSRLEYAVNQLLKGPASNERQSGIYTEIPKGTKLLGIKETKQKIIVDINSEFQYGGGTDSLYNRTKQLIKTVIYNSNGKPVYLYLDGKQADVIGGEGLMVKQPLNENSLDE